MVLAVFLAFGICSLGLQNGVERITKVMMLCLLGSDRCACRFILLLWTEPWKVLNFYLIPNFENMKEAGIGNVIFGAMSQAFFTLSIGIGAMEIFGSYMKKDLTTGRRKSQYSCAGYLCCTDGRHDHYSCMFCV